MNHACSSPLAFENDMDGLLDVGLVNLGEAIRIYGILPPHDNPSYFLKTWNAALKPHPKMMAWVERLKTADVQIAMVSNMGLDHAAYIRLTWPAFFKDCSLHLSCEVGARKPSKLYFDCFDNNHKVFKWPRPILYLDDKEENLKQGKNYGFKPCHFNLESFIKWPNKAQDDDLEALFNVITNKK